MTIIIPAYKPDEKLIRLLCDLRKITTARILVVNDGSGADFEPVFEQAKELCDLLLVHEVNQGKGAAMKTAFAYLLEENAESGAICTADADGQHLPEDILRCLTCAEENPGTLVLGSRAFVGNVPLKSMLGNTITRITFQILMGKRVFDTQTGLRAFTPELLPQMLEIAENRYEYEMRMLCNAVRKKTPIKEVEIQTVYIEENKSSHFNPFKDAMRVYGLLFRCAWGPFFEMISFVFSSVFAFLVDSAAFFVFLHYLVPAILGEGSAHVSFVALLLARILSSLVNYAINGKVVFQNTENKTRSLFLYFALVVVIFFANDFIIDWLRFDSGWLDKASKFHSVLAHFLSQIICFPLSFFAQKYIVFPKGKKTK